MSGSLIMQLCRSYIRTHPNAIWVTRGSEEVHLALPMHCRLRPIIAIMCGCDRV
nr:hypothetical protein Iba_chr01bCG14850 [Ipomoea batatas]